MALQNQIHDLHSPIASNGLFWTVPVPEDGFKILPDGTIVVEVRDLSIIDQPHYPDEGPTFPAKFSFRVTWRPIDSEPVKFRNTEKQYAVQGFLATSTIEFSVRVPGRRFAFRTTDADDTSPPSYAVVGHEVNGHFFQ